MAALYANEPAAKAWSSSYITSLPDSAFACVDTSGRHYPHHDRSGKLDLPHLRNALSRLAQDDTTSCGASHLRAHAKAQDVSQLLISVCVVIAASVALFAVGFVLGTHKTGPRAGLQADLTVHLILTLGTVIFSWMLVHTVFGLRYAHMFYGDSDDPTLARHAGGLEFPGQHPPNYFDFAYFSFVIGMTCQVSDVQITSRKMRRLTLLHSVLSFGFNTVILALLINTVSSLL